MKALLSNQERIKRRQIIQYALADELSPQQIQQAITLWDEFFHDSPTFVAKIFHFTNKLTEALNLTSSEQLKLMTNLVSSYNLLKNIDVTKLQETEIQQRTMTDDYVIFNAILSEIIIYIKQHYADELPLFKQYLLEDMHQFKLPAKTQQTLLSWCQFIDNNGFVIDKNVSERQMAEFIDFLYEELCDMLAAKQTDLLFSIIVNNCEKRPEAKRFSPHELI